MLNSLTSVGFFCFISHHSTFLVLLQTHMFYFPHHYTIHHLSHKFQLKYSLHRSKPEHFQFIFIFYFQFYLYKSNTFHIFYVCNFKNIMLFPTIQLCRPYCHLRSSFPSLHLQNKWNHPVIVTPLPLYCSFMILFTL